MRDEDLDAHPNRAVSVEEGDIENAPRVQADLRAGNHDDVPEGSIDVVVAPRATSANHWNRTAGASPVLDGQGDTELRRGVESRLG
jgi:hypothetical protein